MLMRSVLARVACPVWGAVLAVGVPRVGFCVRVLGHVPVRVGFCVRVLRSVPVRVGVWARVLGAVPVRVGSMCWHVLARVVLLG